MHLKYIFFCCLFIALLTRAKAQIQHRFDSLVSEAYQTFGEERELRKQVRGLEMFILRNDSLKTVPNYYVLANLYRTGLAEEETAVSYEKEAEKIMFGGITTDEFSSTIRKITKTSDIKYLNQIISQKQKDPDYLKHIDDHMLAIQFERLGDFETAEMLYQRHLNTLDLEKPEHLLQLSSYINFLIKMGHFQQAERYLDQMKQGAASSDSIYTQSLKITVATTRAMLYLRTGDYYRYLEEMEKYHTLTEPMYETMYCDAADFGRYSTQASGYELLENYDAAERAWSMYDKEQQAYLTCMRDTMPEMASYHPLPMAPLFRTRRYGLDVMSDSLEMLINEVDAYLQSISISGVMADQTAGLYYGYLGDPRYETYYDRLIQYVETWQDFSVATKPMAEYAYFLMRDGAWKRSLRQYEALFEANISWINRMVFVFGEQAFITYFNSSFRQGYDNFLSFVRKVQLEEQAEFGTMAAMGYDNLLLTKSLAFRATKKKQRAFLQAEDSATVALFNQWLLVKNKLIGLYQQQEGDVEGNTDADQEEVRELQETLQRLENNLAVQSKAFQEMIEVEAPSWKTVRKSLQPGEAAIEIVKFQWRDQVYYSDTSFYSAYIVKHDSEHPEVVYLPTLADELEGKYYNYYQNAIRYQLDDRESYRRFWLPVMERLQGIKKVFLSPDGIYHLISLPTLKNPESNDYLIDELDLKIVATTLPGYEKETPPDWRYAVLLGRPDYAARRASVKDVPAQERSFVADLARTTIADLPGTEGEVLDIARTLQTSGVEVSVLLNEQATEDTLYAVETPDILHLATHGYWSPPQYESTPSFRMFHALMHAGLLLAGVSYYYMGNSRGDKYDGVLTAYEAQLLALEGTQLVVLSACETGLGAYQAGEGVYGLQRAFQKAGARHVIISLWKVDDTATQKFMATFYEQYLHLQDVGRAFRLTQQIIKAAYPSPYYWGAFVLVK